MKYFYTRINIGEGMPTDDFVFVARTLGSAEKKALKMLKTDYREYYETAKNDISIREVTAELLARMILIVK